MPRAVSKKHGKNDILTDQLAVQSFFFHFTSYIINSERQRMYVKHKVKYVSNIISEWMKTKKKKTEFVGIFEDAYHYGSI